MGTIDLTKRPGNRTEIGKLNKADTIAWLTHLGVAHVPENKSRELNNLLKDTLFPEGAETNTPPPPLNIEIPPAGTTDTPTDTAPPTESSWMNEDGAIDRSVGKA